MCHTISPPTRATRATGVSLTRREGSDQEELAAHEEAHGEKVNHPDEEPAL
jgi:hypothetical protein